MAVTFSGPELSRLRGEIRPGGMTLEEAQQIVEEATATGEIHTRAGNPVQFPMSYYQLRLAATGSSSHQFAGVRFGNSEGRDKEIRAAMWSIFQATEVPDAEKRRNNTDTANRKTRVSRGSQSKIVQFTMPDSLDKNEAMAVAERAVNQWIEDWESKKAENARDEVASVARKLQNLGLSAEDLAGALGVSVEIAQGMLNIGKVEEATEVEENDEEEDEEEETDGEK